MNLIKQNIEIDLDEEIVKYVTKKCEIDIDLNNLVQDIVKKAIEFNNIIAQNIYVSISSVTENEIKELNNKYRGVDKKTDVLSFPIFERFEIEEMSKDVKVNTNDKNKRNFLNQINLGDIFLCMDVVHYHSIEYETGLLRETLYMITHGICHLLGHDHIKEDEKKEMRDLEEKILNSIEVF